ncbi:TPA: hypothetical protein ACH3X2_002279 [Trebouxia sp. C0005]
MRHISAREGLHREAGRREGPGGSNKGRAGSMGVSEGAGPVARGSATSAGTAEFDGPSVASIETATGASREPELTRVKNLDCCGSRSIRCGAKWLSPALPR